MPFDKNSAPELQQRKTHKVIKGLHGTEVVADDLILSWWGWEALEQRLFRAK